jgi:hypothetical protein
MTGARASHLPYQAKLRLLLDEKYFKWEMHGTVPDEWPLGGLCDQGPLQEGQRPSTTIVVRVTS